MGSSIAELADKCPYLSKHGLYISSSKESKLLLLNLNTGSINHLGPMEDSGELKLEDTCENVTCKGNSTTLTLPTYGRSSFWLILTQYHLDALELSLGSTLWKIKYAELKSLSSIEEERKWSGSSLGYELMTAGLLKLQACVGSESRRRVKWEFTAPAPILGAYQIAKGKHLASLKLNEKLTQNPENLRLYSFQRTVFGAYDWTDKLAETKASHNFIVKDLDYSEAVIPLKSHIALDLMRTNTIKDMEDIKLPPVKNITVVKTKPQLSSTLLIFAYITTILIASAILLKAFKTEGKEEPKPAEQEPPLVNELIRSKSLSDHIVGQLMIYTNKVLGHGSMGTIVYKGAFANRSVAIKRLLRAFNTIATKEVAMLIASDNHPHVIQYFAKEEDAEFIYIALEKCAGSLDQLIEQPAGEIKTTRISKLFTLGEVTLELLIRLFKESLEGLKFLHANRIVHRDLKPQNILISRRRRAKISDMGLCKQLTNIERSFETNAMGTWGWQPAEVLSKQRQNSSIDIFSMGCILYYSLSGGKHPFGDKFSRESNILQGKYSLSDLKNNFSASHLIGHMISLDSSKRPAAADCLNHILFWDNEKRLNFLCDISNKLEYDYGVNQRKGSLIQGFEEVAQTFGLLAHCEGKWNKVIDKFIIEELANHKKKYSFSSSADLIRVTLYPSIRC
eukprot:TRINITY_DN2312_c0_g4_i3.p1 TRINITY_DN2312_c0_g4~~TRINITY_DN2312_c0_g4_i3.p1  ORF type:complete len:678 (-),score=169.58 TRINITY_DN2312_c0_g4_i3:297-2330(-)